MVVKKGFRGCLIQKDNMNIIIDWKNSEVKHPKIQIEVKSNDTKEWIKQFGPFDEMAYCDGIHKFFVVCDFKKKINGYKNGSSLNFRIVILVDDKMIEQEELPYPLFIHENQTYLKYLGVSKEIQLEMKGNFIY